jgi:ketosteroid isomerase-like protein
MRALSATRLLGVLLITSVAYAHGGQSPAKTASGNEQQLTKMLHDFLAAVQRGDRQVFDSFFADDVIYTRSAGVTVNKAEIMKNIDVRAANEPSATFAAEDITVHLYGNMAVVNFRLVMRTEKDGKQETAKFRNTGTFLTRNNKWQVVAWQSTKVPETVEKDHL